MWNKNVVNFGNIMYNDIIFDLESFALIIIVAGLSMFGCCLANEVNLLVAILSIGEFVMVKMFNANGVGNCCGEPCHLHKHVDVKFLVAMPTAFAV